MPNDILEPPLLSTTGEPEQLALIDMPPAWSEQWKGMPGYDHEDLESWKRLIVHFRNRQDQQRFAELLGQRIGARTRSLWYPAADIGHFAGKSYDAQEARNPRYPVYIISKGRWESRLTAKALDKIGVPYSIVVEPQEYEPYAEVIEPSKIIVTPFSNLGQGSIPVRNFVWDHALRHGAERHWILDDNISGFFRYQNNLKCPVGDGTVFAAAEDFTDRYENVALSGLQYFMFVTRKKGNIPPITLNTRIYSCILIRNDLPYRWRGRYNEDTDLSLRCLKDGWCTILFNAFLALKMTTMTMKGGNTDELYQGDGRMKMAESLREQHPDVVQITHKWGRPQHHVNYRKWFSGNKLALKEGIEVPEGEDDYGMSLRILGEAKLDAAATQPEAGSDDFEQELERYEEGLVSDVAEQEEAPSAAEDAVREEVRQEAASSEDSQEAPREESAEQDAVSVGAELHHLAGSDGQTGHDAAREEISEGEEKIERAAVKNSATKNLVDKSGEKPARDKKVADSAFNQLDLFGSM